VTGRAAGRHRVPREPSERRPESLLLLEYSPDGLREFTGLREFDGLRDFPIASTSQFDTIRFGTGQFDTGRTARRRALSLSAALAVVLVVAVVFGGFALLRSSGRTASGNNAVPGFPPPATATASAPQRATSPSPGTRKAAHRHRRGASQTTPPRQPNQVPMPAAPQPTQRAGKQTGKQRASKQSATVSVRYLVASQGPAGFQGEVQVTNNTAQAIAGWQLVIALQGDDVVSFTNATGYVSNGILLLSPANGAQVVPPDGGTLAVFFVAEGTQTMPDACAFNGLTCLS
jgi:hypothetical protein